MYVRADSEKRGENRSTEQSGLVREINVKTVHLRATATKLCRQIDFFILKTSGDAAIGKFPVQYLLKYLAFGSK